MARSRWLVKLGGLDSPSRISVEDSTRDDGFEVSELDQMAGKFRMDTFHLDKVYETQMSAWDSYEYTQNHKNGKRIPISGQTAEPMRARIEILVHLIQQPWPSKR